MTDLHEKAERLAGMLQYELCQENGADLVRDLSARLAEVEADLKSVLAREAATTARYDARLAEVERERDARVPAAYEERERDARVPAKYILAAAIREDKT